MPRKGEIKYDDLEHAQKREYMDQYRDRMKNSFIHFKRKTGLKSADVKEQTSLQDKVAYLKLFDHFGSREETLVFLMKYGLWYHHMLEGQPIAEYCKESVGL